MRDFLRKITPQFILDWNRAKKKQLAREELESKKSAGQIVSKSTLVKQLTEMGIEHGDHLMVHSAMSKIGYLENGPQTFVNALLQVVGKDGTICMPSSPVKTLQLEHIKRGDEFDVKNTPSSMGAITEYFRKLPQTVRSIHPTEPVCALGKLAVELTKDHFGEITPYTTNSPWKKLMECGGKILYIGVTLDNAGTHLHTVEDAVDFCFPIYAEDEFEVLCKDESGAELKMKTKVHNPEFSKRRKCDELIPMFEEQGVLTHQKVGEAKTLLLDARKMFDVMLEAYQQKRITMYTPKGEKIKGYEG